MVLKKTKTCIKLSPAKEIVPACLVNISLAMDGKLYPSLFFANTLTRYMVNFSRCVNRHVLGLNVPYKLQLIHSSLGSATAICAT